MGNNVVQIVDQNKKAGRNLVQELKDMFTEVGSKFIDQTWIPSFVCIYEILERFCSPFEILEDVIFWQTNKRPK